LKVLRNPNGKRRFDLGEKIGSWPQVLLVSTIEEVRAAEKRVQLILDALKKAGTLDPNHLSDELRKATDDYARAVRVGTWVWFINQSPLYECNFLRIDRTTTTRHTRWRLLGAPAFSPLPETSFLIISLLAFCSFQTEVKSHESPRASL